MVAIYKISAFFLVLKPEFQFRKIDMPVQINIFLLLFGGLQGVLFSLFLLRKKLHRGGYIFLLLYLTVLLLQLTLKVMSKGWLMDNWLVLYFYSQFLPLLYGPLAYLSVKYLLNHNRFNLKDLWHFFPACLVFTSMLLVHFNIYVKAGQWLIFNPDFRLVILSVSLLLYHWMAYQIWRQNNSAIKQYFSNTRQLQLNWLRQFITISLITGIVVVAALYLLYMNYPNGHEYRYGFLVLTIIIYWFSYTALTKPTVFSAIKGLGNENSTPSYPTGLLRIYHSTPRYTNSGLSNEQVENICHSLESIVKKEKLYLQPDLTITEVSVKLQCSRHHLSQVLNDHLKKSYYDYINQLRVEEAKQILSNPAFHKEKIATIAYEAGFNSLSTFNEVFRKVTGQTPSQYRKQTAEYAQQKRV